LNGNTSNGNPANTTGNGSGTNTSTSTTPIIGDNGLNNTAAVGNISIFGQLWNFLKGLFK